jgi:hypothetical protein
LFSFGTQFAPIPNPLLKAEDRPTGAELFAVAKPILEGVLDHGARRPFPRSHGSRGYRPALLFPEDAAIVSRIRNHPFRVPAVSLSWPNPVFLAFFSFSRMRKLRGTKAGPNSDSRRRHQIPKGRKKNAHQREL